MNCCGQERDTIFCPDCGTKLVENSFNGIAKFLEGKKANIEAIQQRMAEWDKEHVDRVLSYDQKQRRLRLKSKVETFNRWIEALTKK